MIPKSLVLLTLLTHTFAKAAPYEDATVVRIGDTAPAFTVTTTNGEIFSTNAFAGKVILVNLFATWCGPCQAEMPHLQKGVAEAFADHPDLVVISLAREEGNDVVAPYARRLGLTFRMAGDADRKVYDLFAKGYIPRNYLIGRNGKIIYASVGYDHAEFEDLIQRIRAALSEKPAA
jgi:peroxiredoxin